MEWKDFLIFSVCHRSLSSHDLELTLEQTENDFDETTRNIWRNIVKVKYACSRRLKSLKMSNVEIFYVKFFKYFSEIPFSVRLLILASSLLQYTVYIMRLGDFSKRQRSNSHYTKLWFFILYLFCTQYKIIALFGKSIEHLSSCDNLYLTTMWKRKSAKCQNIYLSIWTDVDASQLLSWVTFKVTIFIQ